MENRIGHAATSRDTTSQVDEALRRVRAVPDTEPLSVFAAAVLERLEWAFAPRAMTPAVLRLRTAMRAAHYNPDLPHEVEAFATYVTVDTTYLTAVLAGRAPIDHRFPRQRVAHTLGVKVVTV